MIEYTNDMPEKKQKYLPTKVCNKCDILLADEVDYPSCPKCNGIVDVIDPTKKIYACPECDYMVNKDLSRNERKKLFCPKCNKRNLNKKLKRIRGTGKEFKTWEVKKSNKYHQYIFDKLSFDLQYYIVPAVSILFFLLLIILFKERISLNMAKIISLALLPLIGIIFFSLMGGIVAIGEIISTIGFLHLILSKNRKIIKVNHGLDHATINVLLEQRLPVFGGISDADGFKIYAKTNEMNIGLAFLEAKERLN